MPPKRSSLRTLDNFLINSNTSLDPPVKKAKVVEKKAPAISNDPEAYKKIYQWCSDYPGSLVDNSAISCSNYTKKIVTLNVNGIRAFIKNGLSYYKDESADIFCLQEVKCSLGKLPNLDLDSDYKTIEYNCGEREGYSGTALFAKNQPVSISKGINMDKHDKEGRVITAEFEDFFLVNVYVPNSGQNLDRLKYRCDEWNKDFSNYLKALDKKKPVILTGDLNVAKEEIDLANPKTNRRSAGFTDEERDGMRNLLKELDFVDAFREKYPERQSYTYWTYMRNSRSKNVGWRLDYFLISRRFFDKVVDIEIRSAVGGSDHCPLVIYLKE